MCGTQAYANANFCGTCGTRLATPLPPTVLAPQKPAYLPEMPAAEPPGKASKAVTVLLVVLGCLLFFGSLAAAVMVPSFLKARAESEASTCTRTVREIGVALEQSKSENDRYPEKLTELTPKYFKEIPTCPSSGNDTYSEGYSVTPSRYTLVCSGKHR